MPRASADIPRPGRIPGHVAVIMDGNGRWAVARGRPRLMGHAAGAKAVRRIVEEARRRGIAVLTLYAFSSDNWERPSTEVEGLMSLLRRYLAAETARCVENGIRLRVMGRRDRLAPDLRRAIEDSERETAHGREMTLRVAIDYSARDAFVRAAERWRDADGSRALDRERFAALLGDDGAEPVPDVDLLIRTGGEQRLSDFLLWECAYAELLFTPRLWPDFSAADFDHALADFAGRERRFGRVPALQADTA